jgi:hypothetical protein
MKRLLLGWVVLALSGCVCGDPPIDLSVGSLEVTIFTEPAWPATVNSVLVRFTRMGGEIGCSSEGASWTRACWCREPGPGCDFSGDPPAVGVVNELCPGEWLLDTGVTAMYSAPACRPEFVLRAGAVTTPSAVRVVSNRVSPVNVSFDATNQVDVDVDFDG